MESISATIELIQLNMDKVANVNRSVTDITNDATSLGENIKVVDRAVKEVAASNKTLVDNMKQVCDIMEVMTESINDAEDTTKVMLSKYEESAKSAVDIENVVGHLMEELGVGGFMGVHDVREGMKIAIAFDGAEYIGEVADRADKTVYVSVDNNIAIDKKQAVCQLRIVVDNVLYSWSEVELKAADKNDKGNYKLVVESNPQVFNRRKYPRMPLANECIITVKETDRAYNGKMVNISANGFAFAVRDEFFANAKGDNVSVDVKGFDILGGKAITGHIIRSSNNNGEYIVGCRMPSDNAAVKEYVSQNYSE